MIWLLTNYIYHRISLIDQWVNLVTALVPSEIACFASSPGKRSLTAD